MCIPIITVYILSKALIAELLALMTRAIYRQHLNYILDDPVAYLGPSYTDVFS